MTGARWEQVRTVLEDALEQAPQDRLAFVARACGGDLALQREVEQYLSCEEMANRALPVTEWMREQSEEAAVAEALEEPERLGAYRILRRIGEGGMGAVYLAERADGEFRQQVALKILKPGLQHARLLRRFRQERQILAKLTHPNIAHLLDGGTAGGQIYYAMEFVEGTPITAYCREHELTIRQRLELFCQVCDAVGYAHRNLIIHRDLKPGNILVTPGGVPKLLDFGLARALDPKIADETASITTGPLLTPAYASPEQVRGEHLGTATDIYSLGVLLYELLTGRNPHLRGQASPVEVCRTVCEDEPAPPSHTANSAVRRQLKGDLDNIVLKALRKEPESRYNSVDELRADLQSYLAGEVVRASRGTGYYRFRKFAGRHRWGLAISAAGAVAAMAAAGMIWWEGHQARMRFNDVRSLAHSVIFELHDAIQGLPGATHARELLVKRALEYLDSLAAQSSGDTSLQLELAGAYEKIGEIQWTATGASHLGDRAGALASQQKALAIRKAILASNPGSTAAKAGLASSYLQIGDLQFDQTGSQDALWDFRQVIRTGEELLAAKSDDRSLRTNLALAYHEIGDILVGNAWYRHRSDVLCKWGSPSPSADIPGALANYQKMQALFEQSAKEQPQDLMARAQVGKGYESLANVRAAQNDFPAALALLRDALAILRGVYERRPNDVNALADFIVVNDNIGNVLAALGKPAAAMGYYAKALALREPLAAADPTNAGAHDGLLWSLMEMSYVSAKVGRLADARRYTSRLIAAQKTWAERPGATADDWQDYAWTLLTCDPPGLRQPVLGLAAAKRAEAINASRDPDILDTLALAWFRTGDRSRAIKTEQEALAHAADPARRKEFEAALRRFENGKSGT